MIDGRVAVKLLTFKDEDGVEYYAPGLSQDEQLIWRGAKNRKRAGKTSLCPTCNRPVHVHITLCHPTVRGAG